MGQLYVPGNAGTSGADATTSQTDQEELLRKHAEQAVEETSSAQPVTTAFLVFQDENGIWAVSSDLKLDLATKRTAALHDIYAGCVSISDEVSAVKTAQHVNQMFAAQMKMIQEQQKNAQLLSKIQAGPRR